MASMAVMDAVKARALTWASLLQCPLVDANEVATSPMKRFLEIEYPASDEDRLDLGTGVNAFYRESGGIRFVLNVLVSDGIDQVSAWVEELRDLFRDTEFAGVVTYEASPAVFDDRNREQRTARYQVPFVVLYHYDYLK